MKKMIYILALSLGMVLSQSVAAFCCCFGTQTQTETRNGVMRIMAVDCTRYTRGTIRVMNYNGDFMGSLNRWPMSPQEAQETFRELEAIFNRSQVPQ